MAILVAQLFSEKNPICHKDVYKRQVQANPGLDENGIFEFMKKKDREKD